MHPLTAYARAFGFSHISTSGSETGTVIGAKSCSTDVSKPVHVSSMTPESVGSSEKSNVDTVASECEGEVHLVRGDTVDRRKSGWCSEKYLQKKNQTRKHARNTNTH